jgi:stress-induced morphogen
MARYPRVTAETKRVEKHLAKYFPNYSVRFPPKSYRYNNASIRVRLVDKCFRGLNLVERHDLVLPILRLLPEKTQDDIMLVLLFTPDEVEDSLANFEFEHPDPLIFSNGRSRRRSMP